MKETSPEYVDLIIEAAKDAVRAEERIRAVDILSEETGHHGKTHYEGINCQTCRIARAIVGEESNMQEMQIASEGEEQ